MPLDDAESLPARSEAPSEETPTETGSGLPEPDGALAPHAERRPVERTVHGIVLNDDYAWLKADNWQEVLRQPTKLPAKIRGLLEAENAYSRAILRPVAPLQKLLLAELRARIKEDDAEVPLSDGPFDYYSRHRTSGEHEIVCRRPRGGGAESILLDADRIAHGKPFFHLVDTQHSPDHRLLAWSADEQGSELARIHVRDLSTGEDLADVIEETEGVVVWASDSRAFYYVRVDSNHRPAQVFRHRIGTAYSADDLIFDDPGAGWFITVRRTQSGRFGVIGVRDHDSSEMHLLDLDDPLARPRLVSPREPGMRYDLEHHFDRLIIRTNADGAQDFKIVEAPLATPNRHFWRDLVAHQPGRMIITGSVFRDFMVRLERENGLPRLVIRDFATALEEAIDFDEDAYALGLEPTLEFDTPIVRFSYSSMRTPIEIWDFDMRSRTRILRKRQEIPSGHDPKAYVTRRVFATAPDGEQVPVSLLYRADTPLDGSAPLLLYGYGAYGHAVPAAFSANRLSLVERGFIYAIAHVRGGTDKGWSWYLNGKLEHKANTFTDFIAAARHVIGTGLSRQGRIIAHGGSAGGMLIGAIANMAPDVFGGLVADVPFVDVLNTMLDDSLPLTPPEWLEWGNPIADRQAFETIRRYSPYDNVRAQTYPPILVLAGLTDPRVTYWEPTKWVAKLRAVMTGGGPVVMRTNMEAGHAGASGRFERLEEVALEYAFALHCATGAFAVRPERPAAPAPSGAAPQA
jgi:oligopeptidase B